MMSTFAAWQAFAAKWGLFYFAVIFIVACGFALWPSRKRALDEAALIPLRED